MSKKMSHKNLLAEGQRLHGIYFSCNCYTFDNIVHYMTRLENFEEGRYLCGDNNKEVNRIIRNLRADFPGTKGCVATQLYYAVGTYGNIGQLYQFEILDSNWERTGETFYIYF